MVGDRDPKFYTELKQINEDLIDFLKATHAKSPYFDFTPTVNDYARQFAELDKQYPERSAGSNGNGNTTFTLDTSQSATNNLATQASASLPLAAPLTPLPTSSGSNPPVFSPPATFSFGSFAQTSAPSATTTTTTTTSTLSASAAPFVPSGLFSSAISSVPSLATSTTTTNSTPFMFGSPAPPPVAANLTSTTTNTSAFGTLSSGSPFSFALAKKEEDDKAQNASVFKPLIGATSAAPAASSGDTNADTNTNDDDDNSVPPEPNVEKFEETGAKHQVRCKLYEDKGEGKPMALGIGILYVKQLEEGKKLQVIIRQEPDLRRVLFNEIITPDSPIRLLPKAVQMVFPNPGEKRGILRIIKVRDEQSSQDLYLILKFKK